MITLYQATSKQLPIIKHLAYEIWPQAYVAILSVEQLEYMLVKFYALDVLEAQMKEGQQFFLAKENGFPVGFLAIEHNCNASQLTKIHKLYVLHSCQGKGIGKQLIDFACTEAKGHNQKGLFLNVNKYNSAQLFYTKLGFSIIQEEVIPIGNGFVMDDYVMQLSF